MTHCDEKTTVVDMPGFHVWKPYHQPFNLTHPVFQTPVTPVDAPDSGSMRQHGGSRARRF
jgi:hypothetical protein